MQDVERQLNQYLAFVANRAVYAIRRAWALSAERGGVALTPEEFLVLEMLSVRNGLTQSELTLAAVRDRTTVTRLVDGLVRKGLVRREHGTQDRRVVRTLSTLKGRRLHQQALEMVARLRTIALKGLAAEQVAQAMDVLHQLRCNLMEVTGESEESEAPRQPTSHSKRPRVASTGERRRSE
jgi:DNA-binding MarR family transcriptional regulator